MSKRISINIQCRQRINHFAKMNKQPSTFIALILVSITSFSQKNEKKIIDNKATKETRALYYNLSKLSENYILFGHQHATEYGHG